MAFLPSKPAGLVSGSLKFLFSSLILSEATVSAPSDMLAHVHLLDLASSRPQSLSLSLSYLPAAELNAVSVSQGDKFLKKFSLGVFLAARFPFSTSFFSISRFDYNTMSV